MGLPLVHWAAIFLSPLPPAQEAVARLWLVNGNGLFKLGQ